MMQSLAQRIQSSKGHRREALVLMSRISSAAFTSALVEQLPGDSPVKIASFRSAVQHVLETTDHVGNLLTPSFNLAERHTVRRKTAASARAWFEGVVQKCRQVSSDLGKSQKGEHHAVRLRVAFGGLTAKNVQAALYRNSMTSDRLTLIGTGAIKLLVQIKGLHRAWTSSTVSMAMLEQQHALLLEARKKIMKVVSRGLPNYPALTLALAHFVSEDDCLSIMRTQFHVCELNKGIRSIFSWHLCPKRKKAWGAQG